jgi:hypothetical protein
MARPKKEETPKVEETVQTEQPKVEQPVEIPPVPEPTPEVAVVESEAKKKFRILIEEYRKQAKPEKFARKEPELLAKLSKL